MTDIGALVRSGRVPYVEGFFRTDGTVRDIEYDGPGLARFALGEPFELDWEYDEDDLVQVDWADRVFLPDGRESVCCGEGPMGADGFFARLDPDGRTLWVAFMVDSNPFLAVTLDGMLATFTNNLGNQVTIDLTGHDFAA